MREDGAKRRILDRSRNLIEFVLRGDRYISGAQREFWRALERADNADLAMMARTTWPTFSPRAWWEIFFSRIRVTGNKN
jgi:hypothetical protein